MPTGRPREFPWVNPEHAIAALRAIVTAWEQNDPKQLNLSIEYGKKLLTGVVEAKEGK